MNTGRSAGNRAARSAASGAKPANRSSKEAVGGSSTDGRRRDGHARRGPPAAEPTTCAVRPYAPAVTPGSRTSPVARRDRLGRRRRAARPALVVAERDGDRAGRQRGVGVGGHHVDLDAGRADGRPHLQRRPPVPVGLPEQAGQQPSELRLVLQPSAVMPDPSWVGHGRDEPGPVPPAGHERVAAGRPQQHVGRRLGGRADVPLDRVPRQCRRWARLLGPAGSSPATTVDAVRTTGDRSDCCGCLSVTSGRANWSGTS